MKKQIHFGNKSYKNNLDFEKLNELQKRLQGTSENSNPVTDPFKFLGEFDSYDKLNETLDTLTYSLGHQKGYGYFRARVGTLAIDIKSILVSSALNAVGQVVQGMLTLNSNKKLTLANGTYKIYFRKHQNNAWGDWKDITAASSGGGSSSGNGDLDLSEYVQKTDENVQHIVGGLIIGSTDTPSAMLSGKHKGRIMLTGVENPLVGVQAGTIPYYVQAHENNMYIGPARPNATSVDKDGKVTMPSNLTVVGDIYEKGTSLSKKYVSKDELSSTELAFTDYVPRKIEEFKGTLKDTIIEWGFAQNENTVKFIIVNGGKPIGPDSEGVVNLGYLGGGSTGDGETTLGSVLDVQINGESIVTNGVAQIYKAATDRLGVVMLSNEYKEEDDDTKVVTQKALHNAYTEFKESENDLLEHFNTVQGLIPDIKIGNESIVEGNTVNLEEHFKTINNNSILGSGDMSFQDLISGNEGDGIYFNDGNDGRPTGLTIQCGNGLSINETDKSLQVNIGNGLTFDETGALTATGSGNVNLSEYVTKSEFAESESDLIEQITTVESKIPDIRIDNNSIIEGNIVNLQDHFRTINGNSILGSGDIDPIKLISDDVIEFFEGRGLYFNDGEDGKDVGLTVNSGNGLSIDDDGVLHVNIGKGLAFDEETNAITATGSDDVNLSDYATKTDLQNTKNSIHTKIDFQDAQLLELIEEVEGSITQIKIGDKNIANESNIIDLEDHFKTINGNSILGSGNIIANAYPRVDHGTSDTTFTLTPNVFHVWDNVESLTLTFETAVSGVTNEYLFQFSCLAGQVTTLGLPEGIMWANGEVPTLEVMKTYQVSILNNCATIQSFG